ncbi:MAG: methylase involved in ubiquinone/menaquinone biosynthesis [Bacteroidetes bacterium]|jgi:SAM-dependent methyltransferase|nr:methylase involved in ubiquinone/menaquinone biosynthesis [Bacteroidota bacterium]
MTENSENRFADRVDNYVKYRPSYPQEVVDLLLQKNYIGRQAVIADIGSGTGISAKLFLQNGFTVIGVEPNEPMRGAAERLLEKELAEKKFISLNGTAEHTGIQNASVDLVIAAQAFHWFEQDKFKAECKRILKPGGHVALIWNDRRTGTTDFLKLYEEFLQMFAIDYAKVNHKNVQDKKVFDHFFGENAYTEYTIESWQDLDLTGLRGRVLSSSYMPNTGHSEYDHMMYVLRKIYQRYQENNKVRLEYDTRIYIGTIK